MGVNFDRDILKWLFACVFAIFMIFGLFCFIGNPFKVINAGDPQFKAENFDFFYYSASEKVEVFRELFPVGTDKSFVDKVLVNAGGAHAAQDKTYQNLWLYREPDDFRVLMRELLRGRVPKGTAAHMFVFDADQKLVNITVNQTFNVYPEQPSYKQIK